MEADARMVGAWYFWDINHSGVVDLVEKHPFPDELNPGYEAFDKAASGCFRGFCHTSIYCLAKRVAIVSIRNCTNVATQQKTNQ